jgi:uncharacterized repeat protein (TIGR01451 family)
MSVSNAAPASRSTITYQLTLTNTGSNPATTIRIVDVLPMGLTYVMAVPSRGSYSSVSGVWSLGNLLPSETVTLDISATVSGLPGSTIRNTASITALDQTDTNAGNNDAAVDITVGTPTVNADLSISLVPSFYQLYEGSFFSFVMTVTNNSVTTANNIVVTNVMPSQVTYFAQSGVGSYNASTGQWTVGSLGAGANATIDIVAYVNNGTADQTFIDTATITNMDETDPNPANNTASASKSIQANPVTIDLVVDNSSPFVGDTVTYTLRLLSHSGSTNSSVKLSALLPADLTLLSATTTRGAYDGLTGVWDVTDLPSGAVETLTLTALVNPSAANTAQTLSASITATAQSDPTTWDNSASVTITVAPLSSTAADLVVSSSVDNPTPREGQRSVFTIAITNNGPDTATGVELTNTFPTGLSFVYVTASQGGYDAVQKRWFVGNILPGSTATLVVNMSVDFGTAGQTITNIANITAMGQTDANTGNNSSSSSVHIPAADLAISQIVSTTNPTAGQNVVYTLTVTNNGPDATTGVQVNDLLPAGLSYVSAIAAQGVYDSSTGIWDIGSLGVGSTVSLSLTANVSTSAAGGTIVNTSTLSVFTLPDTVSANNSASTTIFPVDGEVTDTPTFTPTLTPTFTSTPTDTPTWTFTPTVTNTPVANLDLTSLCSPDPATVRYWRVRSTYTADMPFVWDIVGDPTQTGTLIAPAMSAGVPGEIVFTTQFYVDPHTMRITFDNGKQEAKASNNQQCPGAATATAQYLTSQAQTPSATPTATWTLTPTHTPSWTLTPSETPLPTNLLADPGFESGTLCCGWSGSGTYSITNTDAHSGSYAAQLGPEQSGIFQTIVGLSPNTTYVLRGWVKTVNGTDEIYVGVKNFDGGADWNQFTTATTYTELTITFTTGQSSTSAEVYCWKQTASPSAAYCDNLSLYLQ